MPYAPDLKPKSLHHREHRDHRERQEKPNIFKSNHNKIHGFLCVLCELVRAFDLD
jgi:hypothetical protein